MCKIGEWKLGRKWRRMQTGWWVVKQGRKASLTAKKRTLQRAQPKYGYCDWRSQIKALGVITTFMCGKYKLEIAAYSCCVFLQGLTRVNHPWDNKMNVDPIAQVSKLQATEPIQNAQTLRKRGHDIKKLYTDPIISAFFVGITRDFVLEMNTDQLALLSMAGHGQDKDRLKNSFSDSHRIRNIVRQAYFVQSLLHARSSCVGEMCTFSNSDSRT